jgi:alkanesulfonate monooxygenase SsuD/methylene tetrahydromethanopterin reductase-like flavin-dependent oxidoreductase (luciferase family)
LKAQVETYRRQARERAGREIQIWCNVAVVQRASRAEAEEYVSHYADRHGDEAYLQRFIDVLNPAIDELPPPSRAAARHSLKRGVGAQPLLGTAHDIARSIEALAEQGIDGILLNWIDPRDGITRFNAEVLPLLEAAGLRDRRSL